MTASIEHSLIDFSVPLSVQCVSCGRDEMAGARFVMHDKCASPLPCCSDCASAGAVELECFGCGDAVKRARIVPMDSSIAKEADRRARTGVGKRLAKKRKNSVSLSSRTAVCQICDKELQPLVLHAINSCGRLLGTCWKCSRGLMAGSCCGRKLVCDQVLPVHHVDSLKQLSTLFSKKSKEKVPNDYTTADETQDKVSTSSNIYSAPSWNEMQSMQDMQDMQEMPSAPMEEGVQNNMQEVQDMQDIQEMPSAPMEDGMQDNMQEMLGAQDVQQMQDDYMAESATSFCDQQKQQQQQQKNVRLREAEILKQAQQHLEQQEQLQQARVDNRVDNRVDKQQEWLDRVNQNLNSMEMQRRTRESILKQWQEQQSLASQNFSLMKKNVRDRGQQWARTLFEQGMPPTEIGRRVTDWITISLNNISIDEQNQSAFARTSMEQQLEKLRQ